MAVLEQAMAMGSLHRKDQESGQIGLFDDAEDTTVTDITYPDTAEYKMELILAMEKEYDGFYFSGHPLNAYKAQMDKLTPLSIFYGEDARQYDGRMMYVGGLITAKRQVQTKRNEQMAILTIEDYTQTIQVVIFPRNYAKCQNLTAVDMAVSIRGRADINDESVQFIAEEVVPLGDATGNEAQQQLATADAARHAGALWYPDMGKTKLFIKIPAHLERSDLSSRIAAVLKEHHGDIKVYFHLMGSRRTILTSPEYWVQSDDALRQALEGMLEPGSVVLQ